MRHLAARFFRPDPQLEIELGAPHVKRGNRFLGFTPEGEIVLSWARRMLSDADGLRQALAAAPAGLERRRRRFSPADTIHAQPADHR